MTTFAGSICKIFSDIGYSQYRPIYIVDVSLTANLPGMEARSGKLVNQCHVSTMGKNVPMCLSSIQPNTLGIVETKKIRDHNNIGGINMAIRNIVFSSSEHAYPQSAFIATSEGPTSGQIRENSSFTSKPDSKTGGLVGFRKSLASKAISDKAAKLISGSRRKIPISS